MNSEKEQFLSLKMTPARLGMQETAWFLGFFSASDSHADSRGFIKNSWGTRQQTAVSFLQPLSLKTSAGIRSG
jgi:hypothetical protein